MVAPVIVAASILGGVSLVSGFLGAKAAGNAADVQAQAAQAGIAEQRRQFDITREDFAPFREAEVTALGQAQSARQQQMALLGLGSPEENAAALAALDETPGQQFLRLQQERALLRSASATGGLGGGNVRTALQEQAFGRAQTDIQNRFGRLSSITGMGSPVTTATSQFGASSAQNIANLQAQEGAARASGILGQQQAIAGTISNLAGAASLGGAFTPGGMRTTNPGMRTTTPQIQPQFGGGTPTAFQQPPTLRAT